MSSALKVTQITRTIATSGVPVVIAVTTTKTHSALIVADPDNVGTIYVGDQDVNAASKIGVPISPNDDAEFTATQYEGTTELLDLNLFYVDSTSAGDVVIVTYYVREGVE